MADFVLIDGDQVIFHPTFTPPAMVVVKPGKIKGSAQQTYDGKKICVEGDETKVEVTCNYTAGAFLTPGYGTLKIEALGADQKAKEAKCSGKPVLLKGSVFDAKFEVIKGAQDPNGILDSETQYKGTGQFITTNTIFKAT